MNAPVLMVSPIFVGANGFLKEKTDNPFPPAMYKNSSRISMELPPPWLRAPVLMVLPTFPGLNGSDTISNTARPFPPATYMYCPTITAAAPESCEMAPVEIFATRLGCPASLVSKTPSPLLPNKYRIYPR